MRGVFDLLSGAAKSFYDEFSKAGSKYESSYRPVPGLSSRGIVLQKGGAQPEARESFYKAVPGLRSRGIVLPKGVEGVDAAPSFPYIGQDWPRRAHFGASEDGWNPPSVDHLVVVRSDENPSGAVGGAVGVTPDLSKLRDRIRAGEAGGKRAIEGAPESGEPEGKAKSGTDTSAVVPDINQLREKVRAGQAVAVPRSTDHLFERKPGIDYGRGKTDEGREDRGPVWIEPEWEP